MNNKIKGRPPTERAAWRFATFKFDPEILELIAKISEEKEQTKTSVINRILRLGLEVERDRGILG